MKIAIATDHNGINEKQEIIKYLSQKNYEIIDCSKENYPTDDYPDFAQNVCKLIQENKADYGILLCGTGIGMSIAANKFKGIRCARIASIDDAYYAKFHNNANIISFSYKVPNSEKLEMLDKFLETDFGLEERHVRRINKITNFEEL